MGLRGKISERLPFHRQVSLATRLLPRRWWYRFAIVASALQGELSASFKGRSASLTKAVMLDNWLRQLSSHGAFPLPLEVTGADKLTSGRPNQSVVLLCTHLPLIETSLSAIVSLGYDPPSVLTDFGRMSPEGNVAVPGFGYIAPGIGAGRHVLTKIRSLLRNGSMLSCTADEKMGGSFSPNLLSLVGKLGARLVFHNEERLNNGVIRVHFFDAPRPFCEDAQAIEENISFLRAKNQHMLDELGWTDE